MNTWIMIMIICLLPAAVFADDQGDSKKAYEEAQNLLKDKKQRQEVINKDEKAKKSDQYVDQVVQGDEQQKEKLYQISADVLGNFSSDSPEEANKALSEAARDPAAFLKSLSAEQQKAIQELSKSIESKQDSAAPQKP